MSTKASRLPADGPNTSDIGRIWKTIHEDFMESFRVELKPYDLGNGGTGLLLELVSDGVVDDGGNQLVDVWASKTFANPFHLISTGQLFDLLITSYRVMDRYFAHGEAFAPVRRVK